MIQFYKPTIRRKDMDSVLRTLVDEKIGPGERASFFMHEFAQTTGCRSAAAYRTYPECIESALRLIGACEGTKVALSPLAPKVYLTVLNKLGCVPVYVDVDPENGLADSRADFRGASILVLYDNCGSLALKYNSQTTFAERCVYENISVIEDVSQSIGGNYLQEFKAGDWGSVVVCSCEDEDIVSCAGGAVLGVKGDLTYTLRSSKPSSYYEMTDMNAALGSVQLANLDEDSNVRRTIISLYRDSLMRTEHRQFGFVLTDFQPSGQGFAVFLNSKPEDTVAFAKKYGVPVRMTFGGSIAASYDGDIFADFPVAGALCSRTVSFPVYPFLRKDETELTAKVIAHLP